MRISVIGLGYVGAVSLACLARDGHDIVGVDIDDSKLGLIREGRSPIIEEGIQELMDRMIKTGRVSVTNDVGAAINNTDVSFICVGTPSNPNGSLGLGAIKRVAKQIGDALKHSSTYHVLIFRSTVLPGTTEGEVKPLIEKHSNKKVGEHFGLCFQPEFLREGSSIEDYDNPPYTVIGGDSDRSVEVAKKIFGHLPCDFISTSIRTAEMLKYSCNIYHAMKITFANEVGRMAQELCVDSHMVMDLVCRDTRLNISRAYLKPGFAFGGSCLPKDLRAMLYAAKTGDVSLPMFSSMLPSNQVHIEHAIQMVLETGKKSIGMIGLSFKSGTDDLRESPLVVLAERFIGKGLNLKIYDPEVNVSKLVGANRRYIQESIPHIGSLMLDTCTGLINESDVLIVGLRNADLIEDLYANSRDDQYIIDLVNIPDRARLRGEYKGVCW